MMRSWSFYDLETGEFTGRVYSSPSVDDIAINTPKGCGAVEGRHDRLSHRVDPSTKEIIAWTDTSLIESQSRRQAADSARAQISELERSQIRAMREEILRPNDLDQDGKTPRDRLQAIDDQIASLRSAIKV